MSNLLKIRYFDNLFNLAIVVSSLNIKDGILYDANGDELNWDDMEFVDLNKPIYYKGNHIDGLLIFGDGTIEFHEKESEDAFNFADYPIEIIISVIKQLENIIKGF